MKKLVVASSVFLLSTAVSFASVQDDSLVDAVKEEPVQKELDVEMKIFSSCQDMETVLNSYIRDYYEANKDKYRRGGIYPSIMKDVMMVDAIPEIAETSADMGGAMKVEVPQNLSSDDFSKTNVQIGGVDEADIVKTDGDFIYYFSETPDRKEKSGVVYIVSLKNQKVVKEINLPDNFSRPELYIVKNKLVILGSYYSAASGKTKTLTAIYDTKDVTSLKLLKLYAIDGSYTDSRMIDSELVMLSQDYFHIPFYDIASIDDIALTSDEVLPRAIEIAYSEDTSEHNFKNYPYKVTSDTINCRDIEYNFPSKETLKNTDFNAAFTTVSKIDINELGDSVETKVIAGSTNEIFMNKDSLYLTSRLGNTQAFRCFGLGCVMPRYDGAVNTLIHKYSLTDGYKASGLIPGSPLTQYSMDEKDGVFRILTRIGDWGSGERHTNFYSLDENLKLLGKLEKLGTDEEFKSSRYIGDKLYLVTFEITDPLYVIDVADAKNPKILGELKIPGYSTYLHPYDENYLIGLGYDTSENEWGGVQNDGLKIDLYKIDFDRKAVVAEEENCSEYSYSDCPESCEAVCTPSACGEDICTADCDGENSCVAKADSRLHENKGIYIEQLQTKTVGGKGSNSEALHNPRMFMWNSENNLLLLPAELRDYDERSNSSNSYFQGLIAFRVSPESIVEKKRVDHFPQAELEEKRQADCEEVIAEAKTCKQLLDGTEVCGAVNIGEIPSYCFADASYMDVVAEDSWRYRNYFVNRALWIGDNFFSLSGAKIQAHDMNSFEKVAEIELTKKENK